MLRTWLLILLLLTMSFLVEAQWYYREYQAVSIDSLSRDQLTESLKTTHAKAIASAVCIAMGTAGFFIIPNAEPEPVEDQTFWEQLIGEKGMKTLGMTGCAALAAGGAIAGIVYMQRGYQIRRTLRTNYGPETRIQISGRVLPDRISQRPVPGISVSFRF